MMFTEAPELVPARMLSEHAYYPSLFFFPEMGHRRPKWAPADRWWIPLRRYEQRPARPGSRRETAP